MYLLIYLFAVLFPFCIYPWGILPYYTDAKAEYLTYFVLFLWAVFLLRLRKEKQFPINQFHSGEWILFLFLLLAGVSAALSSHPHVAIYGEENRREGFLALFAYVSLFYFVSRYIVDKYEPFIRHCGQLGPCRYLWHPAAFYIGFSASTILYARLHEKLRFL